MNGEQEKQVTAIQNQIHDLVRELHEDLGHSISERAYGSVEGVAFQINELAKAYSHVSIAAFRKP